jgi:hypothetical protein
MTEETIRRYQLLGVRYELQYYNIYCSPRTRPELFNHDFAAGPIPDPVRDLVFIWRRADIPLHDRKAFEALPP